MKTVSKLANLLYKEPVDGFPSEDIYEDEHLRNLAVAQTKCFGHWSGSKRAACSTCPLAKFCFEKQNLDLESYFVRFQNQSNNPNVENTAVAEEPSQTEEVDTSNKQDLRGTAYRILKAKIKGICPVCDSDFAVGEDVLWLAGKGTWHKDCCITD
mgnify:CR=1 FL=1